MEFYYYIALAFLFGITFSYLFLKSRFNAKYFTLAERNKIFEENNSNILNELRLERNKVLELSAFNSSIQANHENLAKKLEERNNEIENLQKRLTVEFENIANKIFKEKNDQNRDNLNQILNPLSEKIKDFEKKVEQVYISDTRDRAGLIQQIKSLYDLNQQMSRDANNLTNALKGNSKTVGNWGEFILENILEKSGLVKGREYKVQGVIYSEEGKKFQPDIIINLPENKSIIIDSKVSLVAYEKYVSNDDEIQRQICLKDHINSVRSHVKNLSSKNYQSIYQLDSLDFVLMFMPIEPAFALAVQNDPELFNEAFDKNIVIVSPSTLLATLRTIASIWRQEHQNKNALEIARQGGALYDKFQSLIIDLIDIGKKMKSTQDSYEDAMRKLYVGKGNLIGSVERLKTLGAKTSKSIPPPPQNILAKVEDEEVNKEQIDISFTEKK